LERVHKNTLGDISSFLGVNGGAKKKSLSATTQSRKKPVKARKTK